VPSRYLSTVLVGLERIYRFRTAQRGAPEEVELDLPIQTVTDVSRLAERGTGIGYGFANAGFWCFTGSTIHVATGNLLVTFVPSNPTFSVNGFPQGGYDPVDFMAWVYGMWMDVNDSVDYKASNMFVQHAPTSVGPTAATQVIARQLVVTGDSVAAATTGAFTTVELAGDAQNVVSMPFPILQRSRASNASIGMNSQSDSSGTVTINHSGLLWIGQQGATPPGMS